MRKLITIIVLMIASVTLYAQNTYQDVVYLKNGSIIRGTIIEQVPNVSIKIETSDRNVFVYKVDEIQKLTKEQDQNKTARAKNPGNGLTKGYRGILEAGYQIAVGSYGLERIKLNYINAYQFNPYLAAGIGTGANLYTQGDGALLIPLYAYFRATFLNSSITPYVGVGAGYSFDATDSFRGVGILISPSVGANFKVSDKSAMNLGVGCDLQQLRIVNDGRVYGYDYFYISKEYSTAISINLGFSF